MFIKYSHPYDESSLYHHKHTSRTTAQGPHHPTVSVCWWEFHKCAQKCPFVFKWKLLGHKAQFTSWALPRQQVGLGHSDGRHITHSGPTCSVKIYHIIHYPWTCVLFQGQDFVQTLHPMNTQCKISFGMKICGWIIPTTQGSWRMETSKECGNSPHMTKLTWDRDFLLREYYNVA